MKRLSLIVCFVVCGAAVFIVVARRAQSGQVGALVRLQQTNPGAQQIGHSHISGTARAGEFVGGGAGLTSVNADLLDGLNSTAFGQLAGGNTWAGTNAFGNAANSFTGNGSGLTSLNATSITSGTLADARLSFNIALLSGNQTFTGANTFSNAANSFTGNGSGLTALNASNIASGTLADARLSANVPLLNADQTFMGANLFSNAANSFTGNGSGLTKLNASNVASGTLADARLSANVALLNGNQTFTGANLFSNAANVFVGNGAGLTALNASNIATGTLADERLSTNVPLLDKDNAFGNFLNTFAGQVGIGIATPSAKLGVVSLGNSEAVFALNAVEGGTAVFGVASSEGLTRGVHGRSDSTSEAAAGVKGEGNGAPVAGVPNAAALQIDNGAITVTGGTRPAGTIPALGPWICMDSWQNPPGPVPPHCHPIGATKDIFLINNLIKVDSIIILTVVDPPPPPGKACFVQVLVQNPGVATLRVAVMGSSQCIFPCSYTGDVRIHYLIINPI